jgi:hypothetical protein
MFLAERFWPEQKIIIIIIIIIINIEEEEEEGEKERKPNKIVQYKHSSDNKQSDIHVR